MATNHVTSLVMGDVSDTTAAARTDSPQNYMEHRIAYYISLVYVPICVTLGVVGNGVSFCVLVFTSMRKTTTCLYMASIALMDTLILAINFIYYLDNYFLDYEYQTWSCRVVMFLFYVIVHYDVLLLLAMTVERYIAIKYPLKASSMITTRKTIITIACIGMFCVTINMYNLFTRYGAWDDSLKEYTCVFKGDLDIFFMTKVHPWIDSTLYCFIPMTSLFVLNVLIIRAINQAAKGRHEMRNCTSNGSEGQGHRQVTLMLMLVSFAFLLLSAPVAIKLIVERYAWMPTSSHGRAKLKLISTIVNNIMYTNHMVNFLLYCISGKRFRQQLRKLFTLRRGPSAESRISYIVPSSASFRGSRGSVRGAYVGSPPG